MEQTRVGEAPLEFFEQECRQEMHNNMTLEQVLATPVRKFLHESKGRGYAASLHVQTVGQLLSLPRALLTERHRMGIMAVQSVEKRLAPWGLSFGMEPLSGKLASVDIRSIPVEAAMMGGPCPPAERKFLVKILRTTGLCLLGDFSADRVARLRNYPDMNGQRFSWVMESLRRYGIFLQSVPCMAVQASATDSEGAFAGPSAELEEKQLKPVVPLEELPMGNEPSAVSPGSDDAANCTMTLKELLEQSVPAVTLQANGPDILEGILRKGEFSEVRGEGAMRYAAGLSMAVARGLTFMGLATGRTPVAWMVPEKVSEKISPIRDCFLQFCKKAADVPDGIRFVTPFDEAAIFMGPPFLEQMPENSLVVLPDAPMAVGGMSCPSSEYSRIRRCAAEKHSHVLILANGKWPVTCQYVSHIGRPDLTIVMIGNKVRQYLGPDGRPVSPAQACKSNFIGGTDSPKKEQ